MNYGVGQRGGGGGEAAVHGVGEVGLGGAFGLGQSGVKRGEGIALGASTSPVSELGLDVSNETNSDATGATMIVHYHAGSHHGRAEVPVTIKLCPGSGDCS